MIVGIGTDILQLPRLIAAYERTQGRLAERILGPQELQVFGQRLARNQRRGMAYLATRFAAKEAFSKAIGLGMHMPMSWRAMQTLNEVSGKPAIHYSDLLAQWMAERNWDAQVTVSDEQDMVIAFVIVSVS
ncbi:AcpS Phosphopantetheinyl transferase (holo-ACP synthase) [Burkholderiaceae bacterium]|jgi:holo-[acyl-carrier protein] synthase